MIRKTLAFFTATILFLGLIVGCSEDDGSTLDSANTSYTEEEKITDLAEVKIGVCIHKFSDEYMSLFKYELENNLIEAGFLEENIRIVNSSLSHGYEILQIKKLIDEGIDILIVNPVNTSKTGDITDLAMDAGIPLIYVNREPDASEEVRWELNDMDVTYIGCDARQAGTIQGNIIKDLGFETVDKNGDGVIQYVMVEGEKNNNDAYFRTKYSIEALTKGGWRMVCLDDGYGNWDKNVAEFVVTKAFEKQLHPEVIFCNNDTMALGALKAVENAGYVAGEDMYIVGVDAFEEALNEILEGKIVGTVFNNYVEQARLTTGAVLSYVKKQDVEHFYGSNYVKVTEKNADTILEIIKKDEENDTSTE